MSEIKISIIINTIASYKMCQLFNSFEPSFAE